MPRCPKEEIYHPSILARPRSSFSLPEDYRAQQPPKNANGEKIVARARDSSMRVGISRSSAKCQATCRERKGLSAPSCSVLYEGDCQALPCGHARFLQYANGTFVHVVLRAESALMWSVRGRLTRELRQAARHPRPKRSANEENSPLLALVGDRRRKRPCSALVQEHAVPY